MLVISVPIPSPLTMAVAMGEGSSIENREAYPDARDVGLGLANLFAEANRVFGCGGLWRGALILAGDEVCHVPRHERDGLCCVASVVS